jgi:hypothetical protein
MQNLSIDPFEAWLRRDFVEFNTELEEAYFSARVEILLERPRLDRIKLALVQDGAEWIARIADDGTIPSGELDRYQLLGAVGYYLGACRRHEVDGLDQDWAQALAPAWSLANRLGSSLGVAPRFVFAHQSIYNPTTRDAYRTFTSLPDERFFITYNGLGVLAYQRAAEALRRIPAMGVSSPLATYLFENALSGLNDVMRFNRTLAEKLDADRFFFNIRPYFKPHRVGGIEYRGVNAGDFAAINEIDLLLGLCRAEDPFYQHVIAGKYAYVPPEDRVLLRKAVGTGSLLESFLREASAGQPTSQLAANAHLFLKICQTHGAAYSYHHYKLVKPFLEEPARQAPNDRLKDITASGLPLEEVVDGLQRLSDLRLARNRPDVVTARASLDRLQLLVGPGG